MQRIEKTVFLSYRRTNAAWALAISQSLHQNGYDVFFDFSGIASGAFAKVIIENIRARAHFVVLLTPSALDRCSEPGDWLRREIETALEEKRNIVPLTLEGFDFATPKIISQLTGPLAALKGYNALSVPAEYFSEAMTRLREKYLSVPLNAVLHSASASAIQAAKLEQAAARTAPAVTENELTAQALFERAFSSTQIDDRLWYLTESMRLRPAPDPAESDKANALPRRRYAKANLESSDKNEDYNRNLEKLIKTQAQMLKQAREDLEDSFDVTLEAFGDLLDLKDSQADGHSRRVTAYTIALARAMGVATSQIKIIARGAFLHDIGKMAIPSEILNKTGKLSSNEEAVMRQHTTRGYEILRKIPFLKEAAEIVRCHQERFDGSGYPRGLRGADIPFGARIFAVADCLDAITCDRPFQKARSFQVAQKEILRSSGSQFDPGIVSIFLKIPIDLWKELRREIGEPQSWFRSPA